MTRILIVGHEPDITSFGRAIPASQKIREIEEGIEPVETRVLENPDEIFNHMNMLLGMHLKDYFVHQVAECRWSITITLICTFLLLSYGCRKVNSRISNY